MLRLFIIEDNARARGEDVKRCLCSERQRTKAGGYKDGKASHSPGGAGEGDTSDLRRGT